MSIGSQSNYVTIVITIMLIEHTMQLFSYIFLAAGHIILIVSVLICRENTKGLKLLGSASLGLVYMAVFVQSVNASTLVQGLLIANYIILSFGAFALIACRYPFKRIRAQVIRTSVQAFGLIALTLFLDYIQFKQLIGSTGEFTIFTWAVFAASLVVFVLSVRRITAWSVAEADIVTSKTLPSVTLAIPARNETHALTQNLENALAIHYEKLEILVVDDCSYDKTSQMIRSFAHRGIRFIKAEEPSLDWLGKNHAYKALASEASGEYVLFCGVDIELGPDSITRLVSYAKRRKLDMVSVLPQRNHPDVLSAALQPLRYFWQLIGVGRPHVPVVSSCWLIKRDTLDKLGSFDAVRRAIVPEHYFAKELSKKKKYGFVFGKNLMQVFTRKRIESQFETTLRTSYPAQRSNWVAAVIAAYFLFSFAIYPYIYFVTSWAHQSNAYILLVSTVLVWLAYALLSRKTNQGTWLILVLFFPIKLVIELFLIVLSAVLYETNEITWKQRNICEPIILTKE